MANYNSLTDYKKGQIKRIAKLKQGKRRGPITAAKYMALQLRSMVPYKTGRVRNSIRRSKSTVSVSGENAGFPYIHWINATPGTGLERIRLAKRPTRFGTWPRRSTRERDPQKWTQLMSYAETNHTGEPGFFWKAQARTRKFYRDFMLSNTRKVLKGEI